MLLLSDPIIAKFYLPAFIIAQFAIGWRTLLAAAVIDAALMIYIVNYDADGPAGVMGVALLAIIAMGFTAGIVARALSFCLAPFREKSVRCVVLIIISAVALPECLIFYAKNFSIVNFIGIIALPYLAWLRIIRVDRRELP